LWRVRVTIVAMEQHYLFRSLSVVLVIQHAVRMRLIMLSPAACSAAQNFSTLFHKRQDFWKEAIES